MTWFNKQSRIVQLILLLIPVVNWVVEIFVRVTAIIEKPTLRNLIGLLLGVILGFAFGWVDFIWVLIFNHLFLCK